MKVKIGKHLLYVEGGVVENTHFLGPLKQGKVIIRKEGSSIQVQIHA